MLRSSSIRKMKLVARSTLEKYVGSKNVMNTNKFLNKCNTENMVVGGRTS